MYSANDIKELKNKIKNNDIDFAKFKSEYNIRLLRETYQGYYAILNQNNEKDVFVFINKENKIYDIIVSDSFKTYDDFKFLTVGKTTMNEVIEFDSNSIILPLYNVVITTHIVKDGVVVIHYNNFNGSEYLDNPVIEKILFCDNDSIEENQTDPVFTMTPYIMA